MTTWTWLLPLLAAGRITIGLLPFVAAGPLSRGLGFPVAHDSATARLMARLFGVRDVGLGVLALHVLERPQEATFVFLFNAAMDAGDLVSILVPLVRRQGIDRAALLSAAMAVTGGSAWLLTWALTAPPAG